MKLYNVLGAAQYLLHHPAFDQLVHQFIQMGNLRQVGRIKPIHSGLYSALNPLQKAVGLVLK